MSEPETSEKMETNEEEIVEKKTEKESESPEEEAEEVEKMEVPVEPEWEAPTGKDAIPW